MAAAHILIVVSIATMPATRYTGKDSFNYPAIYSTWSSVTMQRFEDRPACEHAAKQIRALQNSSHDLRMTCQPVGLAQAERDQATQPKDTP